jgi:glycosyltransferase involved in cell wall biosynthesis
MRTLLHLESSPGLGGQEIRTLAEARWTAERGWRVLIAGQPAGQLCARARGVPGVEVIAVSMRGAWDPRALVALVRLIRRERVDIVHTHSSVDAWLGGLAARLAGVPVVRTRHVSIPIRQRWNPVYSRLADRVLTSAEAIRRMVIGAGVPADRVLAMPAGIDLATFVFDRRCPETRRALEMTGPVIGSVAMFRGSKGHDDLLAAFARVRERHPEATLLLVGDGVRRAGVELRAREMGLGRAVVFTGFRPDVPDLLGAMDCFVLASTRTEGVPQSLLQAFAAGVPVVARNTGGIPEVVTDGVTGTLVRDPAPAALAEAIIGVLADPEGARRRARAARALVESRFSHAAAVERLLAVYAELLAPRRPQARAA